ncbi:MAG: Bug family tripartite tricarboxylate transporter substrate binding protein [Lautropia sp.]
MFRNASPAAGIDGPTAPRRAARRAALGSLVSVLVATGAAATGTPARADDFPSRPITFVIPFAAGSGTDQLARAVAVSVGASAGVPVVVDNKAGGSGVIAAQAVARAAPNGYTVLITTNTTHAANEHLYRKLPYDPVKDFTPLTLLSKGQMLLLVNPSSASTSVADLIAAAKKTPGKLTFGSGSSSSRVGGELFRQMTGIDVVHVPYKSNPFSITDLVGGQIDYMFADTSTAIPQVRSGKLRALGASGAKRLANVPEVPTIDEAGVAGFDVSYWTAAYLPAGAPPAVAAKLREWLQKAAKGPELAALQAISGTETVVSSGDELAAFQASESRKWGTVIRAAGIVAE